MWDVFGQSDDYSRFIKKAIIEHLYTLIEEKEEISLSELFNEMIHRENQYMTHKLRLEVVLEELEKDAVIEIIDGVIKENKMTFFNENGKLEELSVKELYKKREREEKIKEIIRIYTRSALIELL